MYIQSRKLMMVHFFMSLLYFPSSSMSLFQCFSSCYKKSLKTSPIIVDMRDDIMYIHSNNNEKKSRNVYLMYDPNLCQSLEHITWKTAPPYVPPVSQGKVIKVYDGDTITIATILPNTIDKTIYRFSVRLLGIDSAEMKGGTFAEKESAIKARDALAKKVLGKMVILQNVGLEKYGRILADVYCDNMHINQWMLDSGLAVPYYGGTKHKSDEFVEHW